MQNLWAARFSKPLDALADELNRSIGVDGRMYREDIAGSVAHAHMLGAKGIIPPGDAEAIVEGLNAIREDIDSGELPIDPRAEDIHMFIEAELTKRIGDAGRRLHTARSRNDQVALDTRLYLRGAASAIREGIFAFLGSIVKKATQNADCVLPGYTHMQRAQPITFGQHLLAYAMMLKRDIGRFADASARMNMSPLGACALAGTTYPIDRGMTASELGFSGVCENSMDAVSDRDFAVELASACSILMTHISRFCEELILWTSWEFRFVELDDSFTTGSSIMPQKKNPDMAELIRGKTARVNGNLVALLTLMKGLPLAYNKDMQEDKEAIFDSVDTVIDCLRVLSPMVDGMRVNRAAMREAASRGFINATDCADYLVSKGLPFRTAYKITGQLVARCTAEGTTLETLPLASYKELSDAFEEDLYAAIDLDVCVAKRVSEGGTSPQEVRRQIQTLTVWLTENGYALDAE